MASNAGLGSDSMPTTPTIGYPAACKVCWTIKMTSDRARSSTIAPEDYQCKFKKLKLLHHLGKSSNHSHSSAMSLLELIPTVVTWRSFSAAST